MRSANELSHWKTVRQLLRLLKGLPCRLHGSDKETILKKTDIDKQI